MSKLPEHISYSAFNTYLECGHKYKLTKIYDVQEAHAVWFTGGTAVHLATEYYDQADTLNTDSGFLDEIWNKAWFETIAADEEINGDMNSWNYKGREDVSWWYGEGRWMLERWVTFRNAGWKPYKDFIEKQYEVPIADATVKMAIDRVMLDYNDNLVLLDIKTGASAQRHPLQLAIYAWALRKDGIEVDKAGFWDARSGSISTWNIDHLNTERIEDILNTFDKARKSDIFLPNLSNCGRCGIMTYCKYLNGRNAIEEK